MSIRKKTILVLIISISVVLLIYSAFALAFKNVAENATLEILESRGKYNESMKIIDKENYTVLSEALIYNYFKNEIKPGDNYEIINYDIESDFSLNPLNVLTGSVNLKFGFSIKYKGRIYKMEKDENCLPVNCLIKRDGLKVAFTDRI